MATWMVKSGVHALLIDCKTDRVKCGQADGLEPRTWEILDSFEIADSLWTRANQTNELCLWVSPVCFP